MNTISFFFIVNDHDEEEEEEEHEEEDEGQVINTSQHRSRALGEHSPKRRRWISGRSPIHTFSSARGSITKAKEPSLGPVVVALVLLLLVKLDWPP